MDIVLMDHAAFAALFAAYLVFLLRRMPRYLHIFQQEEYDSARFAPWLFRTRSFDRKLSLFILMLTLLAERFDMQPLWYQGALIVCMLALAAFEENPKKAGKKKLVMTQRAKRINLIALLLCAGAGFGAFQAGSWLLLIVLVQALPFSLCLANLFLKPFEKHVQNRIMNEARARLAEVNPKIIGITGSFGKTSVKHILGHVLSVNASTYYSPGSVNTLMGVSRVIRENLQDGCRFFLSEMGAYGKGSIARLCALTPPKAAILTSIGAAHYERFKSLDAVVAAKFELIEAVAANGGGPLVIHESLLQQDAARERVSRARPKFIVCGESSEADCRMENIVQTPEGLSLRVTWQDKTYDLFAPLFGAQQAGNMAMAFAMACAVGIAPERAAAAFRTTPQITHRLEVKPQPDGTTIIDDAYNSNPVGFRAALEILSMLGKAKGGRRILITPGMVELGAKHDEEHMVIGKAAQKLVDLALVVGPHRIPTFVSGFNETAEGNPVEGQGLYGFNSFADAQAWVHENGKPNDVILLENDLPDLYEKRLKL